MESKVSYRTFENKAKQSEMNLRAFFVLFTSRATTGNENKSLTDELMYLPIKRSGTEMAHGSSKQRSASECNKHTVENMCKQTTHFSHVCSALLSSFTFLLSLSLNSRKVATFCFPKSHYFRMSNRSMYLHDTFNESSF